MSSPSIAPALAGRVIGSIDDAFVIAEWRDPGGPAGLPRLIAPPHLHRSDDEAWYVLEGTLRVRVGKEELEARAGSAVFVPRGTPHTYWNPGPGPVRYLLAMTANILDRIGAWLGGGLGAFPNSGASALWRQRQRSSLLCRGHCSSRRNHPARLLHPCAPRDPRGSVGRFALRIA